METRLDLVRLRHEIWCYPLLGATPGLATCPLRRPAVHFGSRGFGHKTASGFLALAQGLPFDGNASEGEMDSLPVLFEVDSELGESTSLRCSSRASYAYTGRDIAVDKVLEILGAESTHEVHNHHNFAWREEHLGRTYWLIHAHT